VADLILTCTRPGRPVIAAERPRRAALRLAPPEVPRREPLLLESAGVAAVVANPTAEGVFVRGGKEGPGAAPTSGGLCVGGLFGERGSWWQVGAEPPEGTYALIRWDADSVELISDVCATRTLWYALTDDAFLASTSQRALVMLLGSFELEPEATACFLSSGTLGPTVSWDARLRRLPPDARLVLDRAAWQVTRHEAPFALNQAAADLQTDVARLRSAIAATCGSLNLDLERWVLPLSGGHDSRTLLAFLVENGLRPRCVTWTTRASLRNPLSDASIARVLARRYRVEHELLFLDASDLDADTVVTRFVAANEGRNDEIAGYLDGFALWRDLARAGVQGIVRGDQSYGPVSRPMQPESGRRQVGGATPADYPEGHPLRKLELAPQEWPARLRSGPQDDLKDYRLRLSQQGYIPIILTGLNEPKARYVEIVNPHVSRRVIGTVRSLAPKSRYRAAAYHRISDGLASAVPYARFSSTPSASDLFHRADLHELIVRELVSASVERVLGAEGALKVLTAMSAAAGKRPSARARFRAAVKEASDILPTNLATSLTPAWKGPEALPPAKLAFRALLAGRTMAQLDEDAAATKAWDG
jgi:hypothetical protein